MCTAPIPVRLSSIYSQWPWFRQTPGNDGVWGDLRFQLDDGNADAEWLVVYDEPAPSLRTNTPYERRILFIAEPPGLKDYRSAFVNQFGVLVSPYAIPAFRGRAFIQQSALPWHYGMDHRPERYATAMQWPALAADKPKSKLASIICSQKASLPYHRQRLAFVERLEARLGHRVDVFGRDSRPIDDKQEGIAAYKYHIAVENNEIDHFWTEKVADAYIGGCFPIFAGCKNIGSYFDPRSLRQIDIGDPDRAIDEIESILDSTLWEDNRLHIQESRRRVMTEYNLFAVVAKIIAQSDEKTLAAKRIAPTALRPGRRRRLKALRRSLRTAFARIFSG
jgi:hypothetical protein